MITVVDLFCGCGGMSLGFQNAGYTILAGFENWDSAVACYNANLNNKAIQMDLLNVDAVVPEVTKLTPNVIIGGPPCQDFSVAGSQVEGERANLTVSFAQIITKCLPQYFVMENVQQVAKSEAYQKARKLFKDAGYGLTERVLDASLCGVPQKRKRFFCVGALGNEDDFLAIPFSCNQSIFPLTVHEYFDSNHLPLNINFYYRHPRTYGRRAIYSVDEPSPTIRGVNRPKPQTYNQHTLDAVAPTNIRALTYTERSYIQTFPANYIWNASLSINEQMIGNAVPVNLATYVGEALKSFISNHINPQTINFIEWLKTEKNYSTNAAGDVLSRINRARKIKRLYNYKLENYMQALNNTEDFQKLNPSIQSQINRAITLFYEYKKDIGG